MMNELNFLGPKSLIHFFFAIIHGYLKNELNNVKNLTYLKAYPILENIFIQMTK